MNNTPRFKIAASMRILALLIFAFIGLIVESALMLLVSSMPQFDATLLVVLAQDILVFILPTIAVVFLFYYRPWQQMCLDKAPSLRAIALVVIVCIVSIPALNWCVRWNEGLHLPQSMAAIEQAMRNSEDAAHAMTSMLLSETSLLPMLAVVFVVGIMAGVSEELFFRGGVLRMWNNGGKSHLAVWTVAAVFSAMHMQFFGFFPRLLLGAWLGYLLVWTRSLWVPIIAHSLNNTLVVIATWMSNVGYISSGALDNLGLPNEGNFPWLALASAIATLAIIFALNHTIRPHNE